MNEPTRPGNKIFSNKYEQMIFSIVQNCMPTHHVTITVYSEMFAEISFSRIAFKDLFAMLIKIATGE